MPVPSGLYGLSFGNDGWRGFALSDVLREASDLRSGMFGRRCRGYHQPRQAGARIILNLAFCSSLKEA
jgi:hypothetical protein